MSPQDAQMGYMYHTRGARDTLPSHRLFNCAPACMRTREVPGSSPAGWSNPPTARARPPSPSPAAGTGT
jgi:hypothetical protein